MPKVFTACAVGWALLSTVAAVAETASSQLTSHELESDRVTAQVRLAALFAEKDEFTRNHGGPFPMGTPEATRRTQGLASIYLMPMLYDDARYTDDDERRAIERVQSESAQGKADAHFILGVRKLVGKGVPVDFDGGLRLLESASAGGNAEAMVTLATVYDDGLQVPIDKDKAIALYRQCAATKSLPSLRAQIRLGEIYELGIGVPHDYELAMSFYESAANPSLPESLMTSASLFHSLGSASAEAHIARMYVLGEGVPKDARRGAEWLLKATDAGQGYGGAEYVAQCALAIMYASGVGVTKDLAQAKFWLDRPNSRGSTACNKLN